MNLDFDATEKDLLYRIFDNIEDCDDVPCSLFNKVNLMEYSQVTRMVKFFEFYYQPEDLNEIEINHIWYLMFGVYNSREYSGISVMCSSEPEASVTRRQFRVMFWSKVGINVFHKGDATMSEHKGFHIPNVGLRNRRSRTLAYLLRHDVEL